MPEQNADVVRRIWALWEKGLRERDPATLEAPFEEGLLAPDSTFTPVDAIPGERRTYEGIEGMREFSLMWIEDFSYWSIALDEIVDARNDWVVAELHQEAVGRQRALHGRLHGQGRAGRGPPRLPRSGRGYGGRDGRGMTGPPVGGASPYIRPVAGGARSLPGRSGYP